MHLINFHSSSSSTKSNKQTTTTRRLYHDATCGERILKRSKERSSFIPFSAARTAILKECMTHKQTVKCVESLVKDNRNTYYYHRDSTARCICTHNNYNTVSCFTFVACFAYLLAVCCCSLLLAAACYLLLVVFYYWSVQHNRKYDVCKMNFSLSGVNSSFNSYSQRQ